MNQNLSENSPAANPRPVEPHGGRERKPEPGFRTRKALQLAAVIAIIAVAVLVINSMITRDGSYDDKLADQITKEMDDNRIVLNSTGSRRTVVDFMEPIILEHGAQTRLIVYSAEISESISISSEGLGGWAWTSSYQEITYEGTAQYTVDLSQLSEEDFSVNNEEKTLTVRIPYAVLDPINIPSDKIKFKDVERGSFVAPKDIKLTTEENAQLTTSVNDKMKAKLIDGNYIDLANDAAKEKVAELFSAVVQSVDPEFEVTVVQ